MGISRAAFLVSLFRWTTAKSRFMAQFCSRSYVSLGLKKVSPERKKKKLVIIIITHGLRYNLDEDYVKTGMWSLYNVITIVVGRRCRPKTCNRGVCSKKRSFGIHNGDKDKRDRKLYSTVCENRLHIMYMRGLKSGLGILT
jgi:hypothetical protein